MLISAALTSRVAVAAIGRRASVGIPLGSLRCDSEGLARRRAVRCEQTWKRDNWGISHPASTSSEIANLQGIQVKGPPFKSAIIPKKKGNGSMKTLTESVVIEAPAPKVFAFMDDANHVGFRMSGRFPIAMMGSRLKIEVLSSEPTGVGATNRMWAR